MTDRVAEVPVVDAPPTTVLGVHVGSTRRGSVVFVLIVGLMTCLQVIATPVVAMLSGPFDWPLPLDPAAVFGVLVIACFAQAAALLLSDRRPVLAVFATALVYAVVLVGLGVPNWLDGMYLVIALAQFLLSSRRSPTFAALNMLATIALGMGSLLLWAWAFSGDLANAAAYTSNELARFAAPLFGATALGAWWGIQARHIRLIQAQAELARRDHAARIAEAKERERARIAQELHDVAGQHLAGLGALADAAIALAPQRPGDALRLLEEVRDEGRFAAASLAGALSDLNAEPSTTGDSFHDLRRASDLIAFWTDRGMNVTLHTYDAVVDLPPVVSSTAYRCLQESLTNAAKYAGGAAVVVRLRVIDGTLELQVTNTPAEGVSTVRPGLDLGWGITGMRERVELLRGTLKAGPTEAGGWEVLVRIPLTGA